MKQFSTVYKKQGFTLVELIVVIATIILLSTVSFNLYLDSAKQSRDAVRKAEIEQISLALREYVNIFDTIDCPNGIKIDGTTTVDPDTMILGDSQDCPDAATVLTHLESYFGSVPQDPLGPGNPDYFYYFDATHHCNNAGMGSAALVFAVNLETDDSNAATVCPMVSGNDGGYLRTNTTRVGGSIDPSTPYVKTVGLRVQGS